MNRCLSILFVLLFVATSCRKPSSERDVDASNRLVGKWVFTEHYLGIGGPGQWHPVEPAGQTVEFRPDGRFQSAEGFSTTFSFYKIIDSATVKFSPAPIPSGYVVMKYRLDAGGNSLILYPIQPMCVEGCAYKFQRLRIF